MPTEPVRTGLYDSPITRGKEPGRSDVKPGMPTGATKERTADVDPHVLARARAGDHRAFRALVTHYDRGLRALAYRLLGDAERMDDVLQDVYVKAYRGLASFRGDSSPGTWLYRITYNACLDHLRRTPRAMTVALDDVGDRPAPGGDPADQVVVRSSLADALASLPSEQRAAVLLVDAEGFDHARAAEILGVAEGTVHSRVFRARNALRGHLSERGGER